MKATKLSHCGDSQCVSAGPAGSGSTITDMISVLVFFSVPAAVEVSPVVL